MKWRVKAIFVLSFWAFSFLGTRVLAAPENSGPWMTSGPGGSIGARYFLLFLSFAIAVCAMFDCLRRWGPHDGDHSDEELLKRAGRAKRNLGGMAVFSLLLLIVFAADNMVFAVPGFACVVLAYAVLAVAAGRGDHRSVSIVVVLFAGALFLGTVCCGLLAIWRVPARPAGAIGLVVMGLLYWAFMNSRSVLVQLKERGLLNRAFPRGRPAGGLCTFGGLLLVLGYVGMVGGLATQGFLTIVSQQKEVRMVVAFVDVLQKEDKDLMASFATFEKTNPRIACDRIMMNIDRTEQKFEAAWDEAADDEEMRTILATYGNALKTWRAGIEEFRSPGGDRSEANRLIEEGDRLRIEALQNFRQLCRTRAKG